jgi:hypothetical protein
MRKTLLTSIVLFFGSALLAAPAGGVLSGMVLNSGGKPVAAAGVFVQSADGTAPRALRTDSRGQFRTVRLRSGLYDVRAEAAGMASEWKHNIQITDGGEAEVTLKLIRKLPPRSLKIPSPSAPKAP